MRAHAAAASSRSPASLAAEIRSVPSILHYEACHFTTREIEWSGATWLVTYRAVYDGVGWLVISASAEKLPPEAKGGGRA